MEEERDQEEVRKVRQSGRERWFPTSFLSTNQLPVSLYGYWKPQTSSSAQPLQNKMEKKGTPGDLERN